MPFVDTPCFDDCEVMLKLDESGLSLTDGTLTIQGNFTKMRSRIAPNKVSRELIVRAAKVKGVENPVAIDATAGLGEDSFLLAAAGFTVHLYERNPVIAALLQDAINRAMETPGIEQIAHRMHVVETDSVKALPHLQTAPDIVLLDPMFPEKHKSSQAKKKLQLLQRLEAPCADETALLDAALSAHPRKIVIKRPIKGPFLAGRKPDYSLTGKAIRYDCFSLAR